MSEFCKDSKKLGIYLHIPFCVSKCAYCDFYSLKSSKESLNLYTKALKENIRQFADKCKDYTVDTVYFGGGTPSYIGEKYLCDILKSLFKNFNIDNNAEITVEANPESINRKLLDNLILQGVNRLSIGFQSSNNDELKALGRVHSFEEAKEKYFIARQAGFENISIDFMYGLPNQTLDGCVKSLLDFLELKPEHISCYGLKLEEGTALYKEKPKLPDDDLQADMYLKICEILKNEGFRHYEISNFCIDDKISRHNSKYWDLSEYIGLGPGAHSFFKGKRFEYKRDLSQYIKCFSGENSDILFYEEQESFVSPFGEYIMLKLRTDKGINKPEFQEKFNCSFEPYEKVFNKYEKMGFATKEGDTFKLTEEGFLVSNTIILDVLQTPREMEED